MLFKDKGYYMLWSKNTLIFASCQIYCYLYDIHVIVIKYHAVPVQIAYMYVLNEYVYIMKFISC